jgi:hypothetical protein
MLLSEFMDEFNLTIANEFGQEIFNRKYQSTNQISIDLDVPSGLYFLIFQLPSGENRNSKFVIAN